MNVVKSLLIAVCTLTIPLAALAQTTLVPAGATWRYLDNGTDQGTAWRTLNFEDASWSSGPAELGYGDESEGRPEATVIDFGPDSANKYITTYFRYKFNVVNPAAFSNLLLRLVRDDGAVVYLNNTEIFRTNLDTGVVDVAYTNLALAAIGGSDEATFLQQPISPSMLVAGQNIIAVEMHQSGPGSTDLSFDLALVANYSPAPTATLTSPTNNQVIISSAFVVSADASDPENAVAQVDFYQGTTLVGTDTNAPFSVSWTGFSTGNYVLRAVAQDATGLRGTSGPVNITVAEPPPSLLIPLNSVWKYLDDGSNQGTAWRQPGYDDLSWPSGPAELGYGDGGEATVVGFGPNASAKYATTYFRRKFFVSDPSAYGNLVMEVTYDDGCAIYINGNEAARVRIGPEVELNYDTYIGSGADYQAAIVTAPASLLVAGENTIAVEMHQSDGASSDMSFNLRLEGNLSPSIAIVSPSPGQDIPGPTNLTVTVAAVDQDGTVSQVDFFESGNPIGSTTVDPFSITLTNLADGAYVLTARATDNSGGTKLSAPVAFTVTDPNPPTILSAVATTNEVFVTFSKRLSSATAEAPSRYTLTLGRLVNTATLADNLKTVTLGTTALTIGQTYTLTVNGVTDLEGQPVAPNSQITFRVEGFQSADVGGPLPGGSAVAAGNGYDVTAGGAGLTGTSDQFTFQQETRSGDFDLQVRVQGVTLRDAFTKAGLMARENLTAGSRYAAVFATPSISGCLFQYRTNAGGNTVFTGSAPVSYPNTWLRLQRSNLSNFTGFASVDGQSWVQLGRVSINLPPGIFFGFAVSSHTNNNSTVAQFRDFGPTQNTNVAPLVLDREPLGPSTRRGPLVISEIMYHPLSRILNSIEFVEIFNSSLIQEDIGNFRLSGDVDFTFPSDATIAAGGFVLVAQDPVALRNYYGLPSSIVIYGPYTNNAGVGTLPNESGTVRLRTELDAVVFEADYLGRNPWPIAADGAGHSLVLARPSYGEGDVRAWAASDKIGGSPGAVDSFPSDKARTVVINEILANTDAPAQDFVELYNHSNVEVDLGGCWLTDDRDFIGATGNEAATNMYRFSPGRKIAPRGYIVVTESELANFRLSSGGERVYLVNSNQTRVLDVIDFEGQALGKSSGRYPDGAASFVQLSTVTMAAANARPSIGDIVINEIFYNPPTDDNDDEFIELYNRGTNSVNVGGWRFTDGVDFTIPLGTIMPSNSYLVVAANIAKLRANHPSLTPQNSIGNYDGNLDNGGERLALSMPEYIFDTNNVLVATNFIVIDEVTYGTGGRWPQWADGGGSSLELIDPDSDNRFPSSWADSDETAKSSWINAEFNGLAANQYPGVPGDALNIILQGPGEFLLDDVEVFLNANGVNLVTNPGFQAGTTDWFFQGTHEDSVWHSTEGYNSGSSLRVVATRRGDLGANRIRIQLNPAIAVGQSMTMRCKVRWLKGNRFMMMRMRSNIAEAPGDMPVPLNLGTPAARNSRHVANAGPAIYDVVHAPVLPAGGQAVVVTTRVIDPDNVNLLNLVWRPDPGSASTLAMVDNGTGGDAIAGDGIFSATIPGQASGVLVAFYIEARDGLNATSRFPNDAPTRECLIRFGESQPYGHLGAYRLWFTSATRTRWETRGRNSNKELDATFVYNDQRVLYNVGTLYSGSPWHTPSYNGPVGGTVCDYELHPRVDDPFLNAEDLVLASCGNNNNDPSGVAEQSSYWLARKMRVPWNYRRFIHMYVLGNRRGLIFEDTQQPNRDVVEQYFSDDSEGPLHKVEDAFEFDASGDGRIGNVDAKLTMVTTTNNFKWTAQYRWWWRPRAIGNNSPNDFTDLFKVVDAVNATVPQPYTSETESLVDMEEWMAYFCFQHIVGNWDAYGYRRGKNTYAYKPERGKWKLLPWDIDFDLGYGGDGVTQNLFDTGGVEPRVAFMYTHPPFLRAYWRACTNAVAPGGPLQNAVFDPVIDAKYKALIANGVTAVAPTVEKNFVAGRRAYIQGQIPQAVFNVTTPANGFSTTNNYVDINGTAPVTYHTVYVNGRPAFWNAVTGWSIRLELSAGANAINIEARDPDGKVIAGSSRTLNVTFNGVVPNPQDYIAITEIMYNPDRPQGAYIELMNRSAIHSFDLTGWRIDGLDYNFADGFVLRAGQIAVVAEDFGKYIQYYGTNSTLIGTYNGRFDPEGETIALLKPGPNPAQPIIVDRVRYEAVRPWPTAASGTGSSLQLIDITQDHSRVSNWSDGRDWKFFSFSGTPTTNLFMLYMTPSGGEVYIDDIWICQGSVPEGGPNLLQNGGFEAPFAGTWNTNLNTAGSFITASPVHSGDGALRLHFRSAGGTFTTSFSQTNLPVTTGVVHTISFWYNYGTNASNLRATLSMTSPLFNQILSIRPLYGSPGTVNTIAATLPAYDPIWLNEVLVNNTTGTNDNMGEREPWIELFNRGPSAISLGNYFLSDDYDQLDKWAFPPGATLNPGHRLIWADGEAGETTASHIHTSFRLSNPIGSIVLSRTIAGGQIQIVDYLNYGGLAADTSYGDVPDGQPFTRQVLYTPTAGTTNVAPPVSVFINEWMAANQSFIADPSDNRFDDWFELYNGHSFAVDLSGYFLTDDTNDTLAARTQFRIPDGTVIPARGYLLVWADNDTADNGFNDDLHANFELGRTLDHIRLYAPDGATLIDTVTFSNQVNNISQGRFPDGTPNFAFFNNPTPRSENTLTGNTAPNLTAISDKIVTLGQTLSFTATASDPDTPPQTLSFSLDAAPVGATIGASSGLFSWTPTIGQVPSTNSVTVRVTDNGSPPMSATRSFTLRAYLPPVATITYGSGSVSLAFSTIPGKTYRVEYRNDLNPGPWTPLGDPAVAGGSSLMVSDTTISGQPQRFYRIVQLD